MTFSKSLAWTCLLSIALFTTACIQSKPVNRGEQATFFISRIDPKGVTPVPSNNSFNLPTKTRFNLGVCVSDSGKQAGIAFETFNIEGVYDGTEKGQTITVKTEKNGCLYWSEEIPFAYGLRPTYQRVERKIVGAGYHQGSQTAVMALNPWASVGSRSSEKAVLDLTVEKEQIDPSLIVSGDLRQNLVLGMKARTQDRMTLALTNIDMVNFERATENERKANKYPYFLNLQMAPTLRVVDMQGAEHFQALKSGAFELSVFVWSVTPTNKPGQPTLTTLWKTLKPEAVTPNESGMLTARIPADLPHSPDGKLRMAIRLTPKVTSPEKSFEPSLLQIAPFQSVYNLNNDTRAVAGSHTAVYIKDALASGEMIEEHLNKSLPAERQLVMDNPYFRLSLLTGGYYGNVNCRPDMVSPDPSQRLRCTESNISRRVMMSLSVCPTDLGLNAPFPEGHPFTIEGIEGLNGPIEKQEVFIANGCLNWVDAAEFYRFRPEEFAVRTWKFTDLTSGTSQTVIGRINPADRFQTNLRDTRQIYTNNAKGEPTRKDLLAYFETRKSKDYRARLKLDTITFERLSAENNETNKLFNANAKDEYSVTNDLIPIVRKSYLAVLVPRITRESLGTGSREGNDLDLPDGWYKLTLVVLNSSEKAKRDLSQRIVTASQIPVRVHQKRIVAGVQFPIENLRRAASQNLLLIKVEPLREDLLKFRDPVRAEGLMEGSVFHVVPEEDSFESRTLFGRFVPQANSQSSNVAIETAVHDDLSNFPELKAKPSTNIFTLADDWYDVYRGLRKQRKQADLQKVAAFRQDKTRSAREYANKHGAVYINLDNLAESDNTVILKLIGRYGITAAMLRNYIECGSNDPMMPYQKLTTNCQPISFEEEAKLRQVFCEYMAYNTPDKLSNSGALLRYTGPWSPTIGEQYPENWLPTSSRTYFREACLSDAGLNAMKNIHIGEIEDKVTPKGLQAFGFSMSTNFDYTVGESINYSLGWNNVFAPNAMGGVGDFLSEGFKKTFWGTILKSFTFMLGPSISSSISYSDGTNFGQHDGSGTAVAMDGEDFKIEIYPKVWQSCMAVYLAPGPKNNPILRNMKEYLKQKVTRFYFCTNPQEAPTNASAETRPRLVEEFVWFAQTPPGQGALSNMQEESNRFMYFARGRANMYKLMKLISVEAQANTKEKTRESRAAGDIAANVKAMADAEADLNDAFNKVQFTFNTQPGVYTEFRGGEMRIRPRHSVRALDLMSQSPIPGIYDKGGRLELGK